MIVICIAVAIPGILPVISGPALQEKNLHVAAEKEHIIDHAASSSVFMAFLPVIVPVLLIAVNSLFALEKNDSSGLQKIVGVLGEPVIALAIGVLLVFTTVHTWTKQTVSKLILPGAEKAGGRLVIIGAVLAATKMGEHFGQSLNLADMGIFFPFLLTFILQTAQASSQ